jgi:glucose-6-phosphate isomerase
MESIGKEKDLSGETVHQGLTVYGNKGSTDQHAFVQQLREGPDDFFVTFVEVLRDRAGESIEVEPRVTSGDYLLGFLLGTRAALHQAGRGSMTITIPTVDALSLGALIALFERTVGLYAGLLGINAYHQPGVEAGKRAAGAVLDLQNRVVDLFERGGMEALTVPEIALRLDAADQADVIFHLVEHLAANGRLHVVRQTQAGDHRYSLR